MICLCCGKPIKNEEAASCGWHHSCIKHFFGTTRLPEITISNEALEWIANETISKGYTVPGVQKKLSLHLSKEEKARLTLVGYPSGYILKPQTNEYRALPEAEQMIMCMADAAGITTVPHGLIQPFEFHQERCRCFFRESAALSDMRTAFCNPAVPHTPVPRSLSKQSAHLQCHSP